MKPGNDVSVNRKALRELLVKSFSYEELNDFCFDYFPDVYERAEGNFGKHVVARLLIDYCQRQGFIKELLALIQEHNAYQYEIYEDELFKPVPRSSSPADEPKATLKLVFPNTNIEDFTPDKQAALLHLLAEELDIPEEDIAIVEIRAGSTIITLRLPVSAARQLVALAQAGHPVLQDLRLGRIEGGPGGLSLWERMVNFLNELMGSANTALLLVIAAILLTALVTIPWLAVTGRFQQKTAPSPIPGFVFVTTTPTLPATPVPPTPTFTPEPTLAHPAVSPIPTPTTSETSTPANTATPTPTKTRIVVPTPTASETFTPTPTETFTVTPTPSHTPTPTETFTLTPTFTPTFTGTPTETATATPTATLTSTATPTATPTPGDNQVTVEGPDRVEGGQLFTVDIAIRNIIPPGVFGGQFALVYPPADLAIVEVMPNPELLVVLVEFDNEVGHLDFAASRQENVPNFIEDVVFVTVTFEARAVDDETVALLELQSVKLGAKGGVDVPASTRDLMVLIEP
jgi:hypothetical protein